MKNLLNIFSVMYSCFHPPKHRTLKFVVFTPESRILQHRGNLHFSCHKFRLFIDITYTSYVY